MPTDFLRPSGLPELSKSQKWDLIMLMCHAGESKRRGILDGDDEDIAAFLSLSEEDFYSFVDYLESENILTRGEDGKLFFVNWKENERCDTLRRQWNNIRKLMAPVVYKLHGRFCNYCGSTIKLTIDHVMPLCRGGTNDLDNLVPACRACNSQKHTKTVEEWKPITER
jgi:hypothetical protein